MDISLFSLGVAMIARDCEDTIANALQSVRDVASQIVVIDTGSSGRTPTIATRMGAEVYFHQWRDNFSYARNLALKYLRTDWVLVLDSDEELDRDSFRLHCPDLWEPMLGGVEVAIVNMLDDGATVAEHRFTRLFRRHPAIRFEGAIHEQVAERIEQAGFQILHSQIRILHHGYRTLTPEKIARNISMHEAELEHNPKSAWHRYHLGLAYFAARRLDRAADLLAALCDDLSLSLPQRELSRLRSAQCALACDELLDAERFIAYPCADVHREGLRLFIMAGIRAAQQRFRDAVELLEHPLTRQSGLVNQTQRAHFAERIGGVLAYHSAQANLPADRWHLALEWQSVFR
jgi:hypothetical protein